MPKKLSAAERLALFIAWGEMCAWCRRPLYFSAFEVEHVLPKHLVAEEAARERGSLLELHGLPKDFDLLGFGNLVPSCGPCNREKGTHPPVHAPAVTLLLDKARERAPGIQSEAVVMVSQNELTKALAVVRKAVEQSQPDTATLAALRTAGEEIVSAVRAVTGHTVTNIHPALGLLWDRERWTEVQPLSGTVAVVGDGRTGGAIGTHWSWICDQCGSNGPWNGNICQTCLRPSYPDW